MSLLLTDGLLRKSLAVARSVGSRGIPVGIGETTRWNPSAFSKYCRESWKYPDPRNASEQFYESLKDRLWRGGYQVLFPMDEPAFAVTMEHSEELSTLCRLLLPSAASFAVADDKGLSVLAAEAAGVDTPKTEMPKSLEQIKEMARRIGYPLVVKPRRSSGSRGIRVVQDELQLISIYEHVHQLFPYPVLQKFIPTGVRYDVCLLYDGDGQLKASFTQREIRHFPLPMGPSTMQESVWMPELVERAKAIMAQIPWIGVVELEFMEDPRTGIPIFMEINSRFWNSLHLAIQSGIDFPWMLYQIALGEKVENVFDYRVGEKSRNILPGEILHFVCNPDRWRLDPPIWAGTTRGGKDDILSWNDPMPSIGFVAACCRYLFDSGAWTRLFKR